MGVAGLWNILEGVSRPVKLETLAKKRLAVDASIWIYQFLKAVRDKEGNALRNSHIVGFFRRICKLLFFGIKPVFVFDGGAPVLKRRTIASRKSQRAGRQEDAIRTAGQILTKQIQRKAVTEAEASQSISQQGDQIPENVVYYGQEEAAPVQQGQKPKAPFRKKDQYHLPELDIPLDQLGPDDPRIMSQQELQEYAAQFRGGEDVNLYDLSKIDFDSEFFRSLPPADQYSILNAARLRSRLRMGLSKEQLDAMFPNRLDFSKFQIERVKERNELTQRLMNLNGVTASAAMRVASEKGREYVLVKNEGAEGGWVLGIVSGAKDEPVVLDEDPAEVLSEDEAEFEDVPILEEEPELDHMSTAGPSIEHAWNSSRSSRPVPEDSDDKLPSQLFTEDEDWTVQRKTSEERDLERAIELSLQQDQRTDDEDMFDDGQPFDIMEASEGEKESEERTLSESPAEMMISQPFTLESSAKEDSLQKDGNSELFKGHIPSESSAEEAVPRAAALKSSNEVLLHPREDISSEDEADVVKDANVAGEEQSKAISEREPLEASVPAMTTPTYEEPQGITFEDDGMQDDSRQTSSIPPMNNDLYHIEARLPIRESKSVAPATSFSSAAQNSKVEIKDEEPEGVTGTFQPTASMESERTIEAVLPFAIDTKSAADENKNTSTDDVATTIAGDTKSTSTNDVPDATFEFDLIAEDERTLLAEMEAEERDYERFSSELNRPDQSLRQTQEEYESEMRALRNQQKKDRRDADEVTTVMIQECQELLKLFGLPFITAPMEAEAQCAELVRLQLVDGIVTDDSDIFLFGGTRVYKNLFNQAKVVECYLSADLEREYDVDRQKLIRLAHLLGSDYAEGLPGVGPVAALELVSEFNSDNGLEEFREWWQRVQNGQEEEGESASPIRKKFKRLAGKLFLPPGFPDQNVDNAYLCPQVDSDPSSFQWGVPDLDALRTFLMSTIGWSKERTDEILVPVIRDMNRRQMEGTQANLTDFFNGSTGAGGFAPRRKDPIKSKRLNTALMSLKEQAELRAREAQSAEAGSSRKTRQRDAQESIVIDSESSDDGHQRAKTKHAPKRPSRAPKDEFVRLKKKKIDM